MGQVAAGSHKLINRIKDTNFSIDDLTHYSLSILVGKYDLQFCVSDTRDNRCLLLEDYTFGDTLSGNRLSDSLYKLFESHELLMAGYWKSIKLAIKNQKFTLIPSTLFSRDNLPHYLHMSAEIDEDIDSFYYYKHVQSEVVLVFAAEKNVIERIRSIYPTRSLQVLHQGSALIEGIQSHRDFTNNRDMYIHIGRTHFSIVVTENNRLLYYNRFSYQDSQDIIKYTMMVMQEMNLDQNSSKVLVWGNVKVNSEHFRQLYRYIRNISYGSKPSYLKFSYVFDELSDHQYFDLYSIYVCE